jgi:DNA repair exonuclease SbcCD ATPase subunit
MSFFAKKYIQAHHTTIQTENNNQGATFDDLIIQLDKSFEEEHKLIKHNSKTATKMMTMFVEELKILSQENENLKQENENLKQENENLKQENENLKQENENLKQENEKIRQETENLKQENENLKQENEHTYMYGMNFLIHEHSKWTSAIDKYWSFVDKKDALKFYSKMLTDWIAAENIDCDYYKEFYDDKDFNAQDLQDTLPETIQMKDGDFLKLIVLRENKTKQ